MISPETSRLRLALLGIVVLSLFSALLARLCYPVAHPSLGFDFCKGYYARVTEKLNGRVMRLLITPRLRASGVSRERNA